MYSRERAICKCGLEIKSNERLPGNYGDIYTFNCPEPSCMKHFSKIVLPEPVLKDFSLKK